jgi:hypothetical protein
MINRPLQPNKGRAENSTNPVKMITADDLTNPKHLSGVNTNELLKVNKTETGGL